MHTKGTYVSQKFNFNNKRAIIPCIYISIKCIISKLRLDSLDDIRNKNFKSEKATYFVFHDF